MRKRSTVVTTLVDPPHLQLLDISEVARLLSVGRTTVYALINARELQTVKIGGSRRVPVISLQQYIQKHMQIF
jgi:excisionase family DNA binding protein